VVEGSIRGVLLIGGAVRSAAVTQIAPAVLRVPVDVPSAAEYVARGSARQAAWTLAGGPAAELDAIANPAP
jgi:xylulokinase